VAAALAEHGADGEVLGVAWDGTGCGPDGTVWGGEFLLATRTCYRRVARLRPFLLPGGEAAARQPWRPALGVLREVVGAGLWDLDLPPVRRARPDASVLAPVLASGACAVWTSSAGRLFDALASLLDLRQDCGYEAEAALLLEQAAAPSAAAYPFVLRERAAPAEPPLEVDWRPLVAALLADRGRGVSCRAMASRAHATLAAIVAAVAGWVGLPRVVLTGGCFQNALLATAAERRLRAAGFTVLTHRAVPPNDGGLAAGQALVAAHRLRAAAA
jgi:hydrogenase maturation protein HypF